MGYNFITHQKVCQTDVTLLQKHAYKGIRTSRPPQALLTPRDSC